ncbi:193_t:CDS:2 [Gigaspora rosea]|nr:193_t:CDS:2 [Gigaspora rosea]
MLVQLLARTYLQNKLEKIVLILLSKQENVSDSSDSKTKRKKIDKRFKNRTRKVLYLKKRIKKEGPQTRGSFLRPQSINLKFAKVFSQETKKSNKEIRVLPKRKLIDACKSIDNDKNNRELFGFKFKEFVCQVEKLQRITTSLEVQETFQITILHNLIEVKWNKNKKDPDSRKSTRAKAFKILSKLAKNNKGLLDTKNNTEVFEFGSEILFKTVALQIENKQRESETDFKSNRKIQN